MIHTRADYRRIQDPAGKIPDDEPVFLIRAQDKVGAQAVRAWADFYEAAGGNPDMARMARDHATLMDDWPTKKLADVVSEAVNRRGWGYPPNSPKAHYFVNGLSICRRWMYRGALENDDLDHSRPIVGAVPICWPESGRVLSHDEHRGDLSSSRR